MRVAHIIKMTRIAGAETHLLYLTAGLQAQGVTPTVLMLHEPQLPMQDFVDAAAQQGVQVLPIPIHHDLDPTLFFRLRQALKHLQPDIVHTHLLHADLYGIPAAKSLRLPVISSRHNDNDFRRKAPFKQVNQALWALADGGIAISEALRRFALEVEGAAPQKVTVIHYGLPFTPQSAESLQAARRTAREQLGQAEDALLFGMVCRLTEQKGIPYALRAFAQVLQQLPQARLVIVGDGPLRDSLMDEAANCGVSGQVDFAGWQPNAAALMAGFDVLLVPSLWEGFGLVILEAMAQEVPVIASAVSAIPEIILPEETGLLVPPRDVAALAAAMTRLGADPTQRARMGQAALARLQSAFSEMRMVQETIAFYRHYVKAPR